jgi:hypothetical protein
MVLAANRAHFAGACADRYRGACAMPPARSLAGRGLLFLLPLICEERPGGYRGGYGHCPSPADNACRGQVVPGSRSREGSMAVGAVRGPTRAVLQPIVSASPQLTRGATIERRRFIAVLLLALRARIGRRRGEGYRQESGDDESNETSVQYPIASPSARADGIRAGPCPA